MSKRVGRRALLVAASAGLSVFGNGSPARAEFIPGHLVAVSVGGSTDVAQVVTLTEYDATTGAKIGSHVLPSTGAAALTLSGQGSHDGHLNLSSDGRYLTLGGYRADAGASSPVTSYDTVTDTNTYLRTVGRVDGAWSVNTATTLERNAYYRTDVTSVATDKGNRFWVGGSGSYTNPLDAANDFSSATTTGGLHYVSQLGAATSVTLNQTTSIVKDANGVEQSPKPDSMRNIRIVNGQLYVLSASQGSYVNRGAFKTADALPTSGPQQMTGVITNTEGSGADPTGKSVPKTDMALLTVNGVPTAYTTGGKNLYEKWAYQAGQWVRIAVATLKSNLNASPEIRALDYTYDGSGVTLMASTNEGIFKLIDTNPAGLTFSSTFPQVPFILPDAGSSFRGFAVVPEPGSLGALAVVAAGGMLGRRRRAAKGQAL